MSPANNARDVDNTTYKPRFSSTVPLRSPAVRTLATLAVSCGFFQKKGQVVMT